MTTNNDEENPAMAQAGSLFITLMVLGLIIFTQHPQSPHDLFAEDNSSVVSNPQIDASEVHNATATMPIAMFNLVNPNGWATPESVTIIGTLQSELGCETNNTNDCTISDMQYDILGDIWRASFELPAGSFSYRATLDHGKHIYGQHAISGDDSPPIQLTLDSPQRVNFYYDHKTGWITDDVNSLIVTMPSNFQDDVGCIEEWNAGCFRTWMQDIDGDGIYNYETLLVPGGSWEARIALNGDLTTSYGQDGTFDGENFPLWIANVGHLSIFTWDSNLNTFTPFISQMPLRLSTELPQVAPNH